MLQKKDIQALLIIGAFYLLLQCVGITCPIKFITGVSCPGCGMSRAWLSLLRLDFSAAYNFHPLFLLPIPALIVFLLRPRMSQRMFRIFIYVMCAMFIAVYALRMFDATNTIVVFRPEDGAVYRLLQWLWQQVT